MAEDVSKLPKWAQSRIELLEMRLREAKKEIEVLTKAPPSEVGVRRYHDDDPSSVAYLPARTTIVFFFDNDPNVHQLDRQGVELHMKHGALEVSTWDTNRRLTVSPITGNVFSIRTEGER